MSTQVPRDSSITVTFWRLDLIMVTPLHPERFMEETGGLFSFSIEKVTEVEVLVNTDGGSSSYFSPLVGNTSLFKTIDIRSDKIFYKP